VSPERLDRLHVEQSCAVSASTSAART
jgi:hypothetical protein